MRPIGFGPEARVEFLESVRYYEEQQTGLGQRFLDSVTDALQRIQSHPESYRKVEAGCRQCRIPRFPYGLIYRVGKERIEVIAVMHLHWEPGYWQQRS